MNHFTTTRKCGLLAAAAAVLIAFPALALDLDGARASGLVGERADGYVAAVSANATPEVRALVQSVNQARKDEYQKVAAKNGQSVDVVEKLAASKIYERAGGGTLFQDASGNWSKK